MLSDKETVKNLPSPRRRGKNAIKTRYSDSQKLEAVKLWLLTGNLAIVSAELNIYYKTLQYWRYSKWWDEVCQELRREGQIQLSNKMRSLAEKAIEQTMDRLENGDWFYDQKTGELRRKPVAMRDANQVMVSAMDRHLKLDNKPAEEENNKKIEDRLAALAKAFETFAKKTQKVEIIDAVYDEREAGLPEREELGEDAEAVEIEGSGEEDPGEAGSDQDEDYPEGIEETDRSSYSFVPGRG